MPRGDGTGPIGQGAGRGNKSGKGTGRLGGNPSGAGGNCACPSCGKIIAHTQGTPCNSIKCPDCGVNMIRQ